MILTAFIFLIILSVLVMVHELGHFITAKKLGIKVEEFGFGLPPRLWGKKIGETVYSLNWLPIGGFVRLYGEEREERRRKKRAFYARPVWQRSAVLLSGVFMNFLLSVFIISFLFTQGVMVPTDKVYVEKVTAGSPAAVSGLKEKDIIRKIKVQKSKFKVEESRTEGGKDTSGVARRDSPEVEELEIKSGEQLIKTTKEHLGEKIGMTIERNGQELNLTIVPRKEYPADEGPMGLVISNFELRKYSLWQAPVLGTKEAFNLSFRLFKGIIGLVWKLISFQPVAKDVAGPVGIAQLTGEAIKFGENAVLELLGLLSLNLAVVNILPFPALDGGRLLFVIIEGTTGKKIRASWEHHIHQIGMIILLTLIVLVTINDLIRIFSK